LDFKEGFLFGGKMNTNRRFFLKAVGTGLLVSGTLSSTSELFAGVGAAGIGMCDWNAGGSADPSIIPKAQQAHLQGLQVSVGTAPNNIPLRQKSIRQQYLELGKKHDIKIHSVAAGSILNKIPLATEPQSAVYVIDALEAAAALGAKNVLLAFFGNGDLCKKNSDGKYIEKKKDGFSTFELDKERVKRVVEVLRQIVPRAEDMGVALGLENTLTAKQNLDIINQIGSPIAQIYYDVGNSTGNGYDVPGEIRLIGNNRICEVHLKDRNTKLLGSSEGQVDMKASAKALADIGYDKWLVLETSGRKGKFIADTQTNVAYAKKAFKMA
jgi:L-ribulose-5-phosphate 3-epimerase